jgi:hypothetical protein
MTTVLVPRTREFFVVIRAQTGRSVNSPLVEYYVYRRRTKQTTNATALGDLMSQVWRQRQPQWALEFWYAVSADQTLNYEQSPHLKRPLIFDDAYRSLLLYRAQRSQW